MFFFQLIPNMAYSAYSALNTLNHWEICGTVRYNSSCKYRVFRVRLEHIIAVV
jgi:hypothetical protein